MNKSSASMPDITEDLDEARLAESAFGEDVVVYWGHGLNRSYGIISGYSDPCPTDQIGTNEDSTFSKKPEVDLGEGGMFTIDLVTRTEDGGWKEIGPTVQLKRTQFVVFGPANHEPEDLDRGPIESGSAFLAAGSAQEALINLKSSRQAYPFLGTIFELLEFRTDHSSADAVFHARLDAKWDPQQNRHRYRLLIRPVEQPIIHDEISFAMKIAEKYGLACSTSSNGAGLEIHQPEEVI